MARYGRPTSPKPRGGRFDRRRRYAFLSILTLFELFS